MTDVCGVSHAAAKGSESVRGNAAPAVEEQALPPAPQAGVFSRTRSHSGRHAAMQIDSPEGKQKHGAGARSTQGGDLARDLGVEPGGRCHVPREEVDFELGQGPHAVEVIGEGSGGVVYKASYRGRLVAVKVAHSAVCLVRGRGEAPVGKDAASSTNANATNANGLSASPIDPERQAKDMLQARS